MSLWPRKKRTQKLSPEFCGALGQFALWLANGSVGHPILENVDYSEIFTDPSVFEAVFIIYANNIEMDKDGIPINCKWAERRAAQYILEHVAGTPPVPAFEPWEDELPGHPPLRDQKPWPK